MCEAALSSAFKLGDIDKKVEITHDPSASPHTDNNTSGVSRLCQTVFAKHARETEQQRVRSTAD